MVMWSTAIDPELVGADRVRAGLSPAFLNPADHRRGLGSRAKGRNSTSLFFSRFSCKSSSKRLRELRPEPCRKSAYNLRSITVTAAPKMLKVNTINRVSNAKLIAMP
jgi:hypothetical protein